MECDRKKLGFTELVECKKEGGYLKASGWSTSTGRSGAWKISPPAGWEFDPDRPDERHPKLGVHGGCPGCIMTLVHYRKKLEPEVEPEVESPVIVQEEPEKSEPAEAEYTLPKLGQPTFEIESPSKLGRMSTYLEKLKEPKVILVLGLVVLAAIAVGIEKAKERVR